MTNAMYQLCVGAGACDLPQSLESQRRIDYYNNIEFKDYPVVYVTWGDANAFCAWAGERLPTEAEWERAARGDDLRTFPWGEDKPDDTFANFNFMVKDTSRVGSYPLGASPFGVLDMAGNVAEWTNDFYHSKLLFESSDPRIQSGPVHGFQFLPRGARWESGRCRDQYPCAEAVLCAWVECKCDPWFKCSISVIFPRALVFVVR